jgi:hypothetical protein
MSFDKILRPDAKHRICLGPLTEGVSGFKVTVDEQTRFIILEPYAEIPLAEQWLFRNPAALSSVRRGMQDSVKKNFVNLGSFAHHLEE